VSSSIDWAAWHAGYDDPDSPPSRRRRSVQACRQHACPARLLEIDEGLADRAEALARGLGEDVAATVR
jgi:hypothetical protein